MKNINKLIESLEKLSGKKVKLKEGNEDYYDYEGPKGIFYIVDKEKNDEWLEKGCPTYTYENRPWAVKARSFYSAARKIEKQPNPENYELECPDDSVWMYIDGEWEEAFN